MTDMMAEIAAFDGRTAKIVGPARSGKTEALLRAQAEAERTRLLSGWHKAVGRSCDWAEH